jgi:hypothetical protein
LANLDHFAGKRVVVTVKLDGENTTLYSDYSHARSVNGRSHPSRDWLKKFHARVKDLMGEYRICGEYMYARHSIAYDSLDTYFYGFSVWDEDACLSWEDTLTIFEVLDIQPVPQLWSGVFDETAIRGICEGIDEKTTEGIVIRAADSFELARFGENIAKYVRAGHVQTDDHWMHGPIIANNLKR